MDDAVIKWETKTPKVFLPDHQVDLETLKGRLQDIKFSGIQSVEESANYLKRCLDEWREHELWKHFQLSWDMFCEIELGKPSEWIDLVISGSPDHDPSEIRLAILQTQERLVDKLDQIIADAKQNPLAENGEIGKSRPSDSRYNITAKRGTGQEYLTRRLARDSPEVLDEIGEGKRFKSVRQAAIHAGIVKPKITIQFSPDESGDQIADKLYRKLSDKQKQELEAWITKT